MKRNAFSVAEAFIALLVFSVALGVSAPMVTKQIKQNNSSDARFTKLKAEIDTLKNQVEALSGVKGEDGEDGEDGENGKLGASKVPSGAIMFFEDDCPDGWKDMSSDYAGRYVRVAGSYDICDKDGENVEGTCVGEKKTIDLVANTKQGEALRRIYGTLPGQDADIGYYTVDSYVETLKRYGALIGAFDFVESSEIEDANSLYDFPEKKDGKWKDLRWRDVKSYGKIFDTQNKYLRFIDPAVMTITNSTGYPMWFINSFDTKRVAPTDNVANETRPKTIVLKACKYN